MATLDLERSRWRGYFDDMAQVTRGSQVYVETSAEEFGDQVESRWLPLNGITYDPKDDVLDVITDAVDHMIHHPSAISIDYDTAGIHNLCVTDREGHRQLIRMKEPMPLPGL
jgi:hypothetical protein